MPRPLTFKRSDDAKIFPKDCSIRNICPDARIDAGGRESPILSLNGGKFFNVIIPMRVRYRYEGSE